MKKTWYSGNTYIILLLRLSLILIAFSLSRMVLFFFNTAYFIQTDFDSLIKLFFTGLRFDLAAILMLSLPYIFFELFPFRFKLLDRFTKYVFWITFIILSIGISFNLIDAVYFRFTLKRSTFDVFYFLGANVGISDLFVAIFLDYWYLILLDIIIVGGLIFGISHFKIEGKPISLSFKNLIYRTFLFLFFIALSIIGARGGLQLKPLNLIDAARMTSSNQIPLLINTPFSLIVTFGHDHLETKDWYPEEEALSYYNPVHQYDKRAELDKKKNVVVLILESFSVNKIGYFNGESKSLTPFLDSLLHKSLTFKGIANGKKSIEGIPAILSGIPTLMNQPYLTSSYASNQMSSLALQLKNYGYTSVFFHGGKNGTMNFDSYAAKAGFDKYFGLNEYPNKADYDGSWGIWDHDFYAFFKSTLDTLKEPFVASFFSLSSHHPYKIPEQFKSKFTEEEPLDNSIAYADFALSKYFESAKKEDWFKRTLFVISADHTTELPGTRDSSDVFHFEIPIAFYSYSDSLLMKKEHRNVMQQSDILPSIIDYLGFHYPFVAFGNSIFDTTAPDFALYYLNGIYHGISTDFIYEFDGEKFSFEKKDQSELTTYLQKQAIIENQTKALIQNYSDFMINNKLKIAD